MLPLPPLLEGFWRQSIGFPFFFSPPIRCSTRTATPKNGSEMKNVMRNRLLRSSNFVHARAKWEATKKHTIAWYIFPSVWLRLYAAMSCASIKWSVQHKLLFLCHSHVACVTFSQHFPDWIFRLNIVQIGGYYRNYLSYAGWVGGRNLICFAFPHARQNVCARARQGTKG